MIPDEIEYEGVVYAVTGIDEKDFIDSSVNSVSIGKNVSYIRSNAFKNTEIGKIEFAKDSRLTSPASQAFISCSLDFPKLPYGLKLLFYKSSMVRESSHYGSMIRGRHVENMAPRCGACDG
ncbi:MAG: leucine-rich repeat protein [Bacteroides sp.]|nr:leucine-rich repeat protein [Bacteroides sp.]